jgi:predicted transcriptional regulator
MAGHANQNAKSTTMTVRLTPDIDKKLDALARDTNRSRSYLAGEAIASFVDVNAWQVARIKHALDEVRSGDAGVPHSDVRAWLDSWGAERELPRPMA